MARFTKNQPDLQTKTDLPGGGGREGRGRGGSGRVGCPVK